MTFGAGGGALLPVVAALLVRTGHPGLEKEHAEKKICLVSERFSFGIQYSMLQADNSGEIGLNWCLIAHYQAYVIRK